MRTCARYAAARGLSNAQVALAWLLNKAPHVIPSPGTRHIAYLEDNVTAAGIELSVEEITELDRLFDPAAVAGARYPDAGFVGVER
jgi:aryl-alcohol dehydrogenase-like predicted oxidoreductase